MHACMHADCAAHARLLDELLLLHVHRWQRVLAGTALPLPCQPWRAHRRSCCFALPCCQFVRPSIRLCKCMPGTQMPEAMAGRPRSASAPALTRTPPCRRRSARRATLPRCGRRPGAIGIHMRMHVCIRSTLLPCLGRPAVRHDELQSMPGSICSCLSSVIFLCAGLARRLLSR